MHADRMHLVHAADPGRHVLGPLHVAGAVGIPAVRVALEFVGHGVHEQVGPVLVALHQRVDPEVLLGRMGPKPFAARDAVAPDDQLDVHSLAGGVVEHPVQFLHRGLVDHRVVGLLRTAPERPVPLRHRHHADEVELVLPAHVDVVRDHVLRTADEVVGRIAHGKEPLAALVAERVRVVRVDEDGPRVVPGHGWVNARGASLSVRSLIRVVGRELGAGPVAQYAAGPLDAERELAAARQTDVHHLALAFRQRTAPPQLPAVELHDELGRGGVVRLGVVQGHDRLERIDAGRNVVGHAAARLGSPARGRTACRR